MSITIAMNFDFWAWIYSSSVFQWMKRNMDKMVYVAITHHVGHTFIYVI